MNTYRVTWRQEIEGYIDNGQYVPAFKDIKADKVEISFGAVKFFKDRKAFLIHPLDLIYSVELVKEGIPEPVRPDASPENSKEPRIISELSDELQRKADEITAGGKGD